MPGLIPVYVPDEPSGFDPVTGAPVFDAGNILNFIRGARILRTGQIPNLTTGNAVLAIPSEATRRSILLRNLGANDIYIGPDQTVSVSTGWRLGVLDGPLVLESADEIWALTSGGVSTLGWLSEIDDE